MKAEEEARIADIQSRKETDKELQDKIDLINKQTSDKEIENKILCN